MSVNTKIVWSEGLFLRPQHFQQQDRHAAHQLEARVAPLRPHPWGIEELSIDRDLLAAGRFALSSAGRRSRAERDRRRHSDPRLDRNGDAGAVALPLHGDRPLTGSTAGVGQRDHA